MTQVLWIIACVLLAVFLLNWPFNWETENQWIAAIVVAVSCVVLWRLMLRLRLQKPSRSECPEGKGLYPECLYIVAIENDEIVNKHPDGKIERIALKNLHEVVVETNSSGPWGVDVWWLLSGPTVDEKCVYPQGATGEDRILEALQVLPGFDDGTLLKAMVCTSEARFVCWRREASTSAKLKC